jgi:hypothetical protein
MDERARRRAGSVAAGQVVLLELDPVTARKGSAPCNPAQAKALLTD